MTDARATRDDPHALPEARGIRGRWPGLVWAIPLAALLICAYLGIRSISHRGVDVTVTFTNAEGVTPGDTKVLVQGVEAGHVVKVRVAPDDSHTEVVLRLDPRLKPALNGATKFWLVGENPTITDIQSIRAAIAGVIVTMAPARGGTPTRDFAGLDQPPPVPPGTPGTSYVLTARGLGSVKAGTSVLYHGEEIGKVERTGLAGLDRFRIDIFVYAPFDDFVRQGAQFWSGSALKLSLSGASLSAGLASAASVLQGSVQFELPAEARANPRAAGGSSFILYDDQASADQGPSGPEIRYDLVLTGAAGDLDRTAKVTLLGYTIGRVDTARLVFAPGSRRPYTAVTIILYPKKLDIVARDGDWRAASDRAVTRLLALGYRAGLIQSPPLVGPHAIVLAPGAGAGAAALGRGGAYPLIPSAKEPTGAQDILAQADDILTKVNRLPIAEIGANLRGLTANLSRITGSPELAGSLTHLDGTLTQLDAIAAQVKPQIGPLMRKLNETADEVRGTAAAARALVGGEGAAQDSSLPEAIRQLDEAGRSIRSLTDYLGRHPEALIRGKAKEKP